ncbi:MAG: hypothetical protein J6U14_08130 [Bacteroidaceae bacterium]|nr:hypothetical protein [Bacteroidaceae bacterium]
MEKRTIIKGGLLALLSMILCLPIVNAQDGIEAIRSHYYAVKQQIAHMEAGEMPAEYYQVKVMRNLPGSGGHEEVINMYYADREDHDIWPSRWLELVTTHYNYAAREYYEEYLYNQNGDIAFIFARNPDVELGSEYEFRFYFEDGLIKVNIRSRKMNTGDFQVVYDGDEIPQEYHSFYYEFANRIKTYRMLFNTVDEAKRS